MELGFEPIYGLVFGTECHNGTLIGPSGSDSYSRGLDTSPKKVLYICML